VGTPAVSTQGMTEPDMAVIASVIGRAIRDEHGSETDELVAQVTSLVTQHPAYPRG
jgi:glycine hydroxymethyltransferase